MSHKKWQPEVITGGSTKPADPNPVTSAFGHRMDRFVADYLRKHPKLSADEALIVLMQFTAGLAVARGMSAEDHSRCSGELFAMEYHVRRNGA